jgi:hypothetical protein
VDSGSSQTQAPGQQASLWRQAPAERFMCGGISGGCHYTCLPPPAPTPLYATLHHSTFTTLR